MSTVRALSSAVGRGTFGWLWTLRAAALAAALSAACSTSHEPAVVPAAPGLTVIAIASDLTIGENRLPLAVLRAAGDPIRDDAAALDVTFVQQESPDEVLNAPAPVWRAWPVGGGIYTTRPNFPRGGLYEFTVTYESSEGPLTGKAAVVVNESSITPAVGSTPPPSPTKTATTASELAEISSDSAPSLELYRLSVDEAVESGRPSVVVFSTPAFCQSAVCGPQVAMIRALRERHGDAANFIHVEIFDNPKEMLATGNPGIGIVSPVVEGWALPSEPWTFIMDADGRIAVKFEAFATETELQEALAAVLDGS